MPNVKLFPYQEDALKRMHNGCILCGGTGTGKSITSLAYIYTKELHGSIKLNGKGEWKPPKVNKDIYIITVASKRDKGEWEDELCRFGLSTDISRSVNGIKVTIDSWNRIQHYKKVYGAVFIFDEDKVTGSGKWAKTFLYISRRNRWIILSATPGDKMIEYLYVFLANGFYKNKQEFIAKHVIRKPYVPYFDIQDYIRKPVLEKHRREVLVIMKRDTDISIVNHNIVCDYDRKKYKDVWARRWDIYEQKPIEETGKLLSLIRRVVNEDPDRVLKLKSVLAHQAKVIIFYNYNFELEILRKVCSELHFTIGEHNGQKHTEVPNTKKWVYICQYNSAGEGWNCVTTNQMIFYSLSYSYKAMKQAAGRINRINTSFKELHYYILQSKAPIDVAILRALSQKRDFNERAFGKNSTIIVKRKPNLKGD